MSTHEIWVKLLENEEQIESVEPPSAILNDARRLLSGKSKTIGGL